MGRIGLGFPYEDFMSIRRRGGNSSGRAGKKAPCPPRLADLILRLLPELPRNIMRGDLVEEYTTLILPRFGKKEADRWYFRQVIFSIGPVLRGEIAGLRIPPKRRENIMETFLHDALYAVRMLRKNLGFTVVALMALALGIGANTAVFSVVNAVLIRPLPYEDPDRLMMVFESNPQKGWKQFVASPANFLDWREQNQVFEQIAATSRASFNLTGEGEPERIPGSSVSGNLFDLLGVKPALGRAFSTEDDRDTSPPVVILSHGLWQRRFGSDANIIGRTLTLNGKSSTVIGVMPAGIQYPGQSEMWSPLALSASDAAARGAHYLLVISRLKKGVSLEQAQNEMSVIASRLEQQYPATNSGWGVNMNSLSDRVIGDMGPSLLMLFGAVSLVLLIACANLANLLLVRGVARQKEIAVRSAIGASRSRIIRQLLTESVLLALVGGTLGLLLAFWGVRALVAINPSGVPRSQEIGIDATVLVFALAISFLTGIIFGLIPALQASKPNLNEMLKEGRSSTGSLRRQRARGFLVVSEVALSLMLLIGAGLLLKSFLRLQNENPGYDSRNALTMTLSLPGSKYKENHKRTAFFDQVLDRFNSMPGVESAAASTSIPFAGDFKWGFEITGRPPMAPSDVPSANYYAVTSDYFRAMKISLTKGRFFNEKDAPGSPRVAIINETMARRYFPDEDPIGKHINITNGPPAPREIVGIVGNVMLSGFNIETPAQMYEPYQQNPASSMVMVVRTTGDPMEIASSIRSQVMAVDSEQPVSNVKTLSQVVSDSIADRTFTVSLFGSFALLALVLAVVGVYGVMAFSVTQRIHEIGIRMALGAGRGEVLRLMMRQGMKPVAAGIAIGAAGAFALAKILSSFSELLHKVSVTDPVVFVFIPLLLGAVASLACAIPARRASKTDPMTALHYE